MVKGKYRIAYLAGFFDGEGCITIQRRRNGKGRSYHYLEVQVTNTDRFSLELYRFTFGGNINPLRDRRSPDHPGWLPRYIWQLEGKEAGECLRTLLPYLGLKRPQAEVGIEFQEVKENKIHKRLTEEQIAVREAQRITLKAMKRQST